MKKDIHPQYFDNATITCSCGAVFKTGSTREKTQVEICSQCHPFYTGKRRIADTRGRVERFKKLTEKAEAKREAAKVAKAAKVKKQKVAKVEKTTKKTAKKK